MRSTLVALLITAAFATSVAWFVQGWRYDAKIARIQSEHSYSLARAEQHARETEQRYIKELDHARTTAQSEYSRLRTTADDASADAQRLRTELARVRRQAASRAAAADRSQNQSDHAPVDMLAGMLERMEKHGRSIAQYADELRIAGLTCEAAFETLR